MDLMREDVQGLSLELDRTNPYRVLRENTGLTQDQLAREVGVTVQYIYRHENGLINTPSTVLSEVLAEKNGATGISATQIQHMYLDWVTKMRALVKLCMHEPNRLLVGPYHDVNHLRDEHPFYAFMFNFNAWWMSTLNIDTDFRSQQLFNRIVCVHPRAVQEYLAGKRHIMPPVLAQALYEVGITEPVISALEHEVDKYLRRLG